MNLWLERLVVLYEYRVYFTVDVFSAANPDFVAALSRKEPLRQHRMFVVVDRSVARAWPDLRTRSAATPGVIAIAWTWSPTRWWGEGRSSRTILRRSPPCRSD
jgi:hypothetical protein